MSLESEFPASSSRRSCSLFVPFMHVVTHIKDHDDDDDDENRRRRRRRRRITMATLAFGLVHRSCRWYLAMQTHTRLWRNRAELFILLPPSLVSLIGLHFNKFSLLSSLFSLIIRIVLWMPISNGTFCYHMLHRLPSTLSLSLSLQVHGIDASDDSTVM